LPKYTKKYKKISTDEIVSSRVIEKLEQAEKSGIPIKWIKSWNYSQASSPFYNPVTKTFYSGRNIMILSVLGEEFTDPRYLTSLNIKNLGGFIKKGSRGIPIVYSNVICKEHRKRDCVGCDDTASRIFFNAHYTVFNVEQCENLNLPELETPELLEFDAIAEAESIVANYTTIPTVAHNGGNRAYYTRLSDSIHLPVKSAFSSVPEYYSTLFHELVHSTLHTSRLDRNFADTTDISHRFGSDSYAKEELVAEIGNAMLCARSGIDTTMDNSVAYIRGWIKQFKNDSKLLLSSANYSNKAVKYITNEHTK